MGLSHIQGRQVLQVTTPLGKDVNMGCLHSHWTHALHTIVNPCSLANHTMSDINWSPTEVLFVGLKMVCAMICHPRIWTPMMLMDTHGHLWTSMDIHGYPWTFMDLYGPLWISMDLRGPLWTSVDLCGSPWTLMDTHGHGHQWISMDLHGPPWTPTEIGWIPLRLVEFHGTQSNSTKVSQ